MKAAAWVAVLILPVLALIACGGGGTAASTAAAAPATRDIGSIQPILARSAASRPALKMLWGPNDLPDGASAFPTYQRLGVDVLETQLSWRAVATARPANATDPNDPAYVWPTALDEMVARAKAANIDVAIMVRQTPDWANGGKGAAEAPTSDADYASFVRAASQRYPHIRYWMIWGEPTRPGNFTPMPPNSRVGPRRYATLLDAAYGALKAQSKRNLVIGGMTWTLGLVTPPDFIRWMRLPNGKPPRMDYYGHNPFAARFPKLSADVYYPGLRDISDADTLHADLAKTYPKHTPKLWFSEFTVASDHNNRAYSYHVSRAAQAQWVTAAFNLVDSVPYVAGLGWYNLADEAGTGTSVLTQGLLDASGQPKPAFGAYQRAK